MDDYDEHQDSYIPNSQVNLTNHYPARNRGNIFPGQGNISYNPLPEETKPDSSVLHIGTFAGSNNDAFSNSKSRESTRYPYGKFAELYQHMLKEELGRSRTEESQGINPNLQSISGRYNEDGKPEDLFNSKALLTSTKPNNSLARQTTSSVDPGNREKSALRFFSKARSKPSLSESFRTDLQKQSNPSPADFHPQNLPHARNSVSPVADRALSSTFHGSYISTPSLDSQKPERQCKSNRPGNYIYNPTISSSSPTISHFNTPERINGIQSLGEHEKESMISTRAEAIGNRPNGEKLHKFLNPLYEAEKQPRVTNVKEPLHIFSKSALPETRKIVSGDSSTSTSAKERFHRISQKTQNLNNDKSPEQVASKFKEDYIDEAQKALLNPTSQPRFNSPEAFIIDSVKKSINAKLAVQVPDEMMLSQIKLSEKHNDEAIRMELSTEPYSKQKEIYDETPKPKLKSDSLTMPTPKIPGGYFDTPLPVTNLTKDDEINSPITGAFEESLKNESEERYNPYSTQVPTKVPSQTVLSRRENKASSARSVLHDNSQKVTASGDLERIKIEEKIKDTDFDKLFENIQDTITSVRVDDQKYKRAFSGHDDSLTFFFEDMGHMLKSTADKLESVDKLFKNLGQSGCDSCLDKTNTNVGDSSKYGTNIIVRIPRLYETVTPSRPEVPAGLLQNRNWRLTWLGLIIFVLGTWSIAEIFMCKAFCHPKYSSRNTWHPSDPFFPYAIPTKLDQWTGRIGSSAFEHVIEWIKPRRRTPRHRPPHLQSEAAAPMHLPRANTAETDSIADDEIWI